MERAGRLLLISFVVLAAALFAVATAKILLVLFAGVLFAIVLRTASTWLARRLHLPTGVCLGAIVLVLLGCGVAFVLRFLPEVATEVHWLKQHLPGVLESVREHWLGKLFMEAPGPDGKAPAAIDPETAMNTAWSALGGSIEVLGSFVVVFFVGLYGAAQPDDYTRAVLALTPSSARERMRTALEAIQHNLSRWLLGRLVAMVFVAITTGIAFAVLKLPMALTLGVLAGALAFIEYAGAVASAIPPLFFALAQSATTALWVLIVYTALHVIEGYVLTPLLSRVAVRLPPAFTLASQVLLGVLLGPLGLTFSTPLLVAAVSGGRAWKESKRALAAPSDGRVERTAA
ncbi:MAG TPA: AI-2E family transporter [Polyangiaceae bacterium]|nr:AI-2E family transporter [Polyangiaceae bacterium]